MSVHTDSVTRVSTYIMYGFTWYETPQGERYWGRVCEELAKLVNSPLLLSPALVPEHYWWRDAQMDLTRMDRWSDTPQGGEYWGDVYENLKGSHRLRIEMVYTIGYVKFPDRKVGHD